MPGPQPRAVLRLALRLQIRDEALHSALVGGGDELALAQVTTPLVLLGFEQVALPPGMALELARARLLQALGRSALRLHLRHRSLSPRLARLERRSPGPGPSGGPTSLARFSAPAPWGS